MLGKMTIKINDIQENYDKISQLLEKVRHAKVEQEIDEDLGTPRDENNVKHIFGELTYKLGAFKDNKLVGIIGGSSINGVFRGIEIKISCIGRLAINPEFWDANIKKKLIDSLLDRLEGDGFDLIYGVLRKKKDNDDINFLLDKGFNPVKGRKNNQALAKILGKKGLKILKEARGMNPVLVQAAKLVAGLKKDKIKRGIIRNGKIKDYDQVIELLNKYSKKFPLARIWTKKEFIEMMERMKKINEWDFSDLKQTYPDTHFGYHFKVWEENNSIIGVALYDITRTRMINKQMPVGGLSFCAFSDLIEIEEAKAFINTLLKEIEGTVAVMYSELPYYANKILKKAGFVGDQMSSTLLMKPMSKKVEGIFEEKIKHYYLDAIGFNI